MNAKRRNAITSLIERLQVLHDEVEQIAQDEQETFDNMPESLQQSERGQTSENAASALDDAVSNLDAAISSGRWRLSPRSRLDAAGVASSTRSRSTARRRTPVRTARRSRSTRRRSSFRFIRRSRFQRAIG